MRLPPADAWEYQLSASWEQEPALLRSPRVLIEEKQVFEYLCNLGRDFSAGRTGEQHVYLALDPGEMAVSAEAFPKLSDESIRGYAARTMELGNSHSFLLYIRNAQVRAPRLSAEVENLLAPVWISGCRWKRVELEIYVGRYDWTPIGVHRERCSNVHHVIRGTKEMLTWAPDALTPRSDKPQCAVNGDASATVQIGIVGHETCVRIEAGPGQAIYVPSGFWHVGISKELSIAVNLSLYGVEPIGNYR
jgi:hypothetical protein